MEKYIFVLNGLIFKLCNELNRELRETNGVIDKPVNYRISLTPIEGYNELTSVEKNESYVYLHDRVDNMILQASNDIDRLLYRLAIGMIQTDIVTITVVSVDSDVLENAIRDNNLLGSTEVDLKG